MNQGHGEEKMNKIILLFFFVFFIPLVSGFHGSSANYEVWGTMAYGSDYLSSSSYAMTTFLIDQPCKHVTQGNYDFFLCYDFLKDEEALSVVVSPNVSSGCAPLTVDFNAIVLDGPGFYKFEWDFDYPSGTDYSYENLFQPLKTVYSHNTYDNIGSYTVKVTVTEKDTNKTGTGYASVDVNEDCSVPLLDVNLSAVPVSGCADVTVNFTAEVENFQGVGYKLLYFWYPTGGVIQLLDVGWSDTDIINLSEYFSGDSHYTTRIAVWEYDASNNFTGRSASDKLTIHIFDAPSAIIQPEGASVVVNKQATFTGSMECVDSYAWSFNPNPGAVEDCTCITSSHPLGVQCADDILSGLVLDIDCSTEGDREIILTGYREPESDEDYAILEVSPNDPPAVNAGGAYYALVGEEISISGYATDYDEDDQITSIEWINLHPDCELVSETANLEGQYADNNAVIRCDYFGLKTIDLNAVDSHELGNTDSAEIHVSGEENNVLIVNDLKITPTARQPPSDLTAKAYIKNLTLEQITVDVTFTLTGEDGTEYAVDSDTYADTGIDAGETLEAEVVFEDQKELVDLESGIYYIKVRADLSEGNLVEEEYFVDNERRETWVNLKQKKMVAVPETNYLAVLIVLLSVISIIYYKRRK